MVLLYSFHNKCMLFLFMRLFCCIYTQISKKEVIRTVEIRCTGDIKYIMQIQRRRNYRGRCVCRPRAYVRKYPSENNYIKFYGIFEREEYAHDI